MKEEGRRNSYRDLIVWQKAMDLTRQVCQMTMTFPQDEIYGLTAQIKRCAVSIPSNIAEGRGRNSDKEFIRFLNISLGSVYELQTQLELALSFNYLTDYKNLDLLSIEVEKMLNALINSKKQKV
ncbi:MAG: four helix bundle protein [Helicobacteraceae bacterium 4484_230]|nr:MAG: four helix bundle protein [Helicobacteraceae bacterium 4484_230]